MTNDPKETGRIVRDGLERACKDFTNRIGGLGFRRTKKAFWTRLRPSTIEFIHFHRHGSSYGAPINYSVDIRVHFGVRILNDANPVITLNGPSSDPETLRLGQYHLRFNSKTGSTYERCVDDLVRFVEERGEPWFREFCEIEDLLVNPKSPLHTEEKRCLAEANAAQACPENVARSLKVFGIE